MDIGKFIWWVSILWLIFVIIFKIVGNVKLIKLKVFIFIILLIKLLIFYEIILIYWDLFCSIVYISYFCDGFVGVILLKYFVLKVKVLGKIFLSNINFK